MAHPLFTSVERPCGMCGAPVLTKQCEKDLAHFCSRRCVGSYVGTLWPRTSSIEIALRDELTRRGISFSPEYPVGQFALDIALPEHQIAIEADGDYWHGRRSQQVKDRRKDAYLSGQGWTVLRFWERDIRADAPACIDVVEAAMQAHAAS